MWTGFPGGSDSKESPWSAGDPGSIPGLGRSPGEGNVNPLQYSCLENPMVREALQAMGSQRVDTTELFSLSLILPGAGELKTSLLWAWKGGPHRRPPSLVPKKTACTVKMLVHCDSLKMCLSIQVNGQPHVEQRSLLSTMACYKKKTIDFKN